MFLPWGVFVIIDDVVFNLGDDDGEFELDVAFPVDVIVIFEY
jgi:hypothetical protein